MKKNLYLSIKDIFIKKYWIFCKHMHFVGIGRSKNAYYIQQSIARDSVKLHYRNAFLSFLKFKNEEIFVNSFDLQGVSWILNLKWLFMCTSGLLYDWITHILSISLPSRLASSFYHWIFLCLRSIWLIVIKKFRCAVWV